MKQESASTEVDLEALALAFVVQVQGSWTPQALEAFQTQLVQHGCTPTETQLEATLERARQHFAQGTAHLFVCMGRPCLKRQKFDTSAPALRRLEEAGHLAVSATECQGPCKQAPVATLRVGQRCEMLAQFMQAADWQAVVEFAQRAAAAGTLLVDLGQAQPFMFDPVHDHDKTSVALRQMQFLLGHFEGEGRYADGSAPFHKEVVGTWEVAGRFLALRMGVTYPLADGHKDTHTALLMIGVNPDTGGLEARAYTDGGNVHDYQLGLEGERVVFDDRPSAHAQIQGARKTVQPTADGFEECLEVDRGSGRFEPYYRITMRRVMPTSQGSSLS